MHIRISSGMEIPVTCRRDSARITLHLSGQGDEYIASEMDARCGRGTVRSRSRGTSLKSPLPSSTPPRAVPVLASDGAGGITIVPHISPHLDRVRSLSCSVTTSAADIRTRSTRASPLRARARAAKPMEPTLQPETSNCRTG
jgi:hypothetical protein